MNKTTTALAQSLVTRPSGQTDESQAANRERKPATDAEIRTAFEKLFHLHSAAGEAVAQFAAIGAIRQVIFRPGSEIFSAYERGAREVREALKPLGDAKATALMDEILSLSHRMVRLETSLPPVRPYNKDDNNRQADNSAAVFSIAGSATELNSAGIALYLGSGTLWNYLGRTVPRPELQVKNCYVLSEPELMDWCKWNGATSDNDIEVVINKVTQYLSTLSQAQPALFSSEIDKS